MREREISKEDSVFIACPYKSQYNLIYTTIIKPLVEELNLICVRADEIEHSNQIMDQIYTQIREARLVIADISEANPNVYYEIGVCHSIGKPVILLSQSGTEVLFDLAQIKRIIYDANVLGFEDKLRRDLKSIIRRLLENPELGKIFNFEDFFKYLYTKDFWEEKIVLGLNGICEFTTTFRVRALHGSIKHLRHSISTAFPETSLVKEYKTLSFTSTTHEKPYIAYKIIKNSDLLVTLEVFFTPFLRENEIAEYKMVEQALGLRVMNQEDLEYALQKKETSVFKHDPRAHSMRILSPVIKNYRRILVFPEGYNIENPDIWVLQHLHHQNEEEERIRKNGFNVQLIDNQWTLITEVENPMWAGYYTLWNPPSKDEYISLCKKSGIQPYLLS